MKARFVLEAINFERGQNPLDSMDIGEKKLRELMRLSNDELIVQAAKGYKKDEDEIIRALLVKNKGTKKGDWQKETAEARAIYNSTDKRDPQGGTNYRTEVRRLMFQDNLEKIKKYRDLGLINDSNLKIRTEFEGNFRRTHRSIPGKLSVRMLQYLMKTINDYSISSYQAPTLIKNANPAELPELVKLIFKTNEGDSSGQDRLEEILIELVYKDAKDLFLEYINQYKGDFYIKEEENLPEWYKKWQLENFAMAAYNKLMDSKYMKDKIDEYKKEIKSLSEHIKDLENENPTPELKKKIVDRYFRDYEKNKIWDKK